MLTPMLSLRRARQLLQPRLRREAGLFLAEGPHLLAAALAASTPLRTIYATERAALEGETGRLVQAAREVGIPIDVIPDADLASLTETDSPQGVVSVAAIPEPTHRLFASEESAARDAGLWLHLDGVQDPGNVGTLLRAAEAFGLRGAVAGKGTADPWSGKVVRAAQGAHFRLEIRAERYDHVETAAFLDGLSAVGGELWTTSLDGEDVYASPPPPETCVLTVGNEARGVRPFVAARAVRSLRIPQRGAADSLNVAMAATVVLSWMTRA
jgi:TrmH family RNA methyltransferase